jgi:two-component system cell cycle response regulator
MMTVTSLPPPPSGPRRILVIDDDDAHRELLTRMLRAEGYEVEALPDGDRVIDRVRSSPPDLVLLDVVLPRITGLELCGELRMLEEARQTSIILMSAQSDGDDEENVIRGLLSGADDYVTTHGRLGELRARIRVQLRNRRDRELLQWAREQRATFRRAARCDALTGLANRRVAEEALDRAIASGAPFSVGLLDVDHFKRVNDTFGHAVGDMVLKEVARALRRSIGPVDLVARFGGEEFVVVAVGGLEQGRGLAERLRRAVEEAAATGPIELPAVTISIGLSGSWCGATPTVESVLKAADDALYRAKHEGRNRAIIAGTTGGEG